MLARIARSVPAIGTSDASLADICACPFSTTTSTPSGLPIDHVPFGPLTLMLPPWTLISTPLAIATGFLATRAMFVTPLRHEAQDFAADALRARLHVGHDALRGRNGGDTESAEGLRDRVLAAVLAQARARHALQLLDDRLAFEILQHDLQRRLGAV